MASVLCGQRSWGEQTVVVCRWNRIWPGLGGNAGSAPLPGLSWLCKHLAQTGRLVVVRCLLIQYTKILQWPLGLCFYESFLLGGSAPGKLMLQTGNRPSPAAALSGLAGRGAWCASSLAWNEYLVLEQSVASVLQAFLVKNFGQISWWPDHCRKEVTQRPVVPCKARAGIQLITIWSFFCCFLFCSNFSFFSCLLYGWKLPPLGHMILGKQLMIVWTWSGETLSYVQTIRYEALGNISSSLDVTKAQ